MTDFAAVKRQARRDRKADFAALRRKDRDRVKRRAETMTRAVRDGLARRCPGCKRIRWLGQFAEDHGRGYGQIRHGETVHERCNTCRGYQRSISADR